MQVPHTAIFHDGELVQWYFGSGGSMKKRHRERMVAWALIEEFCGKNSNSNHQHTKTVATMVTWKPGKDRDSEFVQCRQLTKHKLESVVNGAKANNFTGILQKYVSASSHNRASHDDVGYPETSPHIRSESRIILLFPSPAGTHDLFTPGTFLPPNFLNPIAPNPQT
jgi:hypothetical protein